MNKEKWQCLTGGLTALNSYTGKDLSEVYDSVKKENVELKKNDKLDLNRYYDMVEPDKNSINPSGERNKETTYKDIEENKNL